MNELKIHDIKGLVEVPDYSLYLLIALVFLGITLFVVLLYILYRFYKKKKQSQRKQWYEKLKALDLSDAKKSAYAITRYGRLLASTKKEEEFIDQIITELEGNKYKKEVDPIKKETIAKFQTFMEAIDV